MVVLTVLSQESAFMAVYSTVEVLAKRCTMGLPVMVVSPAMGSWMVQRWRIMPMASEQVPRRVMVSSAQMLVRLGCMAMLGFLRICMGSVRSV